MTFDVTMCGGDRPRWRRVWKWRFCRELLWGQTPTFVGTVPKLFTLLTGTGADKCRAADAATLALDENSVVVADPLFVSGADAFAALYAITDSGVAIVSTTDYADLAALDVHLLSSEQYWLNDGTVGPKTKLVSPAIDAGDRSVVCVEPSPNGRRVNLGACGNTPWASLTPMHGFILFVR